MQLRVMFLLLAFLLSHITYGQLLKPCNTVKSVHNEWVTRFQQRLPIDNFLRSSLTLYFPIKFFNIFYGQIFKKEKKLFLEKYILVNLSHFGI